LGCGSGRKTGAAGPCACRGTFRKALTQASAREELAPDADVDVVARFLTASFQGLRLIGKANPERAVLEDIAATMTILKCLK